MSVTSAPAGASLVGAIDLGGTKADLAVVGPDGATRLRRIPTHADRGAADVLERAAAGLAELAGGDRLAAVAIGVPGVVHGESVSQAPNIPGLDGFDVVGAVTARLGGAPVGLLNDLNAAASAELTDGALVGARTALILGFGTGIAAGVIVDGVLQEGARGAAGEIGVARVPLPPEATDAATGPRPRLEEIVGGRALDRLAARWDLAGAQELLDRLDSDAGIAAIVRPRLEALAAVVGVSCHLLSPERVAVFGGLAAHPAVRAALADPRAGLPAHVELHWAPAGENVALRGAIHHARMLAAR